MKPGKTLSCKNCFRAPVWKYTQLIIPGVDGIDRVWRFCVECDIGICLGYATASSPTATA